MFYPTKPGSEEFLDVSLFIKKLSVCVYNREVCRERERLGLSGDTGFKGIELHNLDRFAKRDCDEFSLSAGSQGYPPESLQSYQDDV